MVFPSSFCSSSHPSSASASPNLRTPWRPAGDRIGRVRSNASDNNDLSIRGRSFPVAFTSTDGCRIAALRTGARTRGFFAYGVLARAATGARPAWPFLYKGPSTCRGGVSVDEGHARGPTHQGYRRREAEKPSPDRRTACTLYVITG